MKFESMLYQENGVINATQLYKDIEDSVKSLKEKLNKEKLDRVNPLQHILNSTSGNYIAPTSMKSFQLCPASYLYSKLVTQKTGSATSVGSTFHNIMEKWYISEDRSTENIYKIMEQLIEEDKQFDQAADIKLYVDGYLNSNDYIGGGKIDHKNLSCSSEVFIKPIIKPLGVDLGVPLYIKIDRIDVREDGIHVIDYKTGIGDPIPYLLGAGGYLPQMIFYKWGVEAEYGQPIKGAYLALPGASDPYKYTKMNVDSLVEQSKVVESVFYHLESARSIRESKQFPTKVMRYCNSCQLKMMCETYIKYKKLDISNIATEIPVSLTFDESETSDQ